jgi:hypothetical protein
MTHILYYVPTWFSGYDIVLEILFALITLAVAYYSFKVYRLSEQREMSLLGFGFLFISFSYSLWAILNGFALTEIQGANSAYELQDATIAATLGIYLHILFFLGGLVFITYMTFKVKSGRLLSLLFALVLLTTIIVEEKYLIIYSLSALLLVFITLSYFKEYHYHKNKRVLITFIAFIFLLLGRLDLSFSSGFGMTYVTGHFLELVAYLLLLYGLISVFKTKPKKLIP